jgi:hypothetical protein
MKQRLHRRWMLALAVFTLAVTALFGLFAMAFVYTVEDRFLERLLQQEAQAHRRAGRQAGRDLGDHQIATLQAGGDHHPVTELAIDLHRLYPGATGGIVLARLEHVHE